MLQMCELIKNRPSYKSTTYFNSRKLLVVYIIWSIFLDRLWLPLIILMYLVVSRIFQIRLHTFFRNSTAANGYSDSMVIIPINNSLKKILD